VASAAENVNTDAEINACTVAAVGNGDEQLSKNVNAHIN